MHGYYWDFLCPIGGTGSFGNGWVVYAMGFGLIVIVGIVLWLMWSRTTTPSNVTPSFPVFPGDARAGTDAAETIARERFARGEIDRDEFDKVIAALRAR